MKSFRRSLNDKSKDGPSSSSHSHTGSTGIPALSKPTAAIQPPKKVIRAKESHTSSSPQELQFHKGDFFYVVGEREDSRGGPGYYEALNTISNARGLVPKSKFEEFGRTGGHGNKPSVSDSGRNSQGNSSHSGPSKPPASRPPRKELYGRMMYDFVAERNDELSATRDEPVLILAISTDDWYVAKKIVTVAGPGLIPRSFVEILDPATGQPHLDVDTLIRESALPNVKEWQEKKESYASSIIPLGRLEDDRSTAGVPNSPFQKQARQQQQDGGSQMQAQQQWAMDSQQQGHFAQQLPSTYQSQQQHGHQKQPSAQQHQRHHHHHAQQPSLSQSIQSYADEPTLPPGTFSSAAVVSFHQEKVDGRQEYFFRVHAVFLPDDPSERALRLILFRTYDDFYRFQINLLDTFPGEAGRVDPNEPGAPPPKRILPFMPGPLDEVNDSITHERRSALDEYIRFLIALHRIDADYVLSSPLVRAFFFAGKSDGSSPIARDVAERELEAERAQEPVIIDLADSVGSLSLGGDHGDDGYGDGPQYQQQQRSSRHDSRQYSQSHSRAGSSAAPLSSSSGHHREPSHHSQSLSHSNGSSSHHHHHQHHGSQSRAHNNTSPLPPIDTTNIRRTPYSASNGLAQQAASPPSSNDYIAGSSGLPSATGTSSSWGSHVGGSSALNSGFSPMTPSHSAGPSGSGASTSAAYKKIKIYDATTDDVMAIRVPPNVSFEQLSAKVEERLGGGRRVLSYRDSVGSGRGTSRGIRDDQDLEDWMSRTDKLVLYAD